MSQNKLFLAIDNTKPGKPEKAASSLCPKCHHGYWEIRDRQIYCGACDYQSIFKAVRRKL
jgi:hypothetical protein